MDSRSYEKYIVIFRHHIVRIFTSIHFVNEIIFKLISQKIIWEKNIFVTFLNMFFPISLH